MKSSSSFDMSQDTVRSSVGNKRMCVLGLFTKDMTFKKKKQKKLTYFQSGERVVNDADQEPPDFQGVDRSVQKEAPLPLLGWFEQHIAPVEVPAKTPKGGG